MTFSFSNLSLAGVEAAAGSSVLPPGKHVVKVTEAKVEDTKAGTGKILKVRLSAKGGVISDNINVHNPSAEATKIGLEQLKSLLVNGSHPDPDNIGAHGVQSIVGLTVGVIVGSEMYQGEARSKVKGYCKPGSVVVSAAAPSPSASPAIGTDDIPF